MNANLRPLQLRVDAANSVRRSIASIRSSSMDCVTVIFDCPIACEIGNGSRRELVIEAGKSHKFTIPEDELPR